MYTWCILNYFYIYWVGMVFDRDPTLKAGLMDRTKDKPSQESQAVKAFSILL